MKKKGGKYYHQNINVWVVCVNNIYALFIQTIHAPQVDNLQSYQKGNEVMRLMIAMIEMKAHLIFFY